MLPKKAVMNEDFLEATSSRNKYYLCNNCGTERRFNKKKQIVSHIKHCQNVICSMCKVIFKNSGFLNDHHCSGAESSGTTNTALYCQGCSKSFSTIWTLRYHIRRSHFNLKAKIPYCQLKKVNQVWFEKVMNSNTILEMRKTSPNTLVLRRLNEKTAIKVSEPDTKTVDLTSMYPFQKKTYIACPICNKTIRGSSISKHKKTHEKTKS